MHTRIQVNKDTRIQGYKDTRIQGYKDIIIQGYKYTRLQECTGTQRFVARAVLRKIESVEIYCD